MVNQAQFNTKILEPSFRISGSDPSPIGPLSRWGFFYAINMRDGPMAGHPVLVLTMGVRLPLPHPFTPSMVTRRGLSMSLDHGGRYE